MTAAANKPSALARLVESTPFTTAIFAVILANAAVLGAQTYEGLVDRYGGLLESLNTVFLAVFVVELALRFAAYGRRPQDFFRSGWNIFDLVVVGAAFVPALRENTTLLRIARLLRVVRVVRLLPHLRVLITAIVRSLPPLGSMSVLTLLILFVYGMIGWTLFGQAAPGEWGNVGLAMLTLFVMLSLENLPQNLERGLEIHPWSWIYFVSFALVAAFIVLNLLIGVVLNSMEEARGIEERRAAKAAGGADGARVDLIAARLALFRSLVEELEHELRSGDGRAPRQREPDEHRHSRTPDA